LDLNAHLVKGIKPVMSASDSLRLAEPLRAIPAGFRQGTEPVHKVPEGFRQGTEPLRPIPDGFRQGTEPSRPSIPDGFRQGTEPSAPRIQTKVVACRGEVINRRCYEFNSTPMTFEDAQLASVTSGDLQSRLVSLVTNGGENNPVLTWLGGMVKNLRASWEDGSEWGYSDWMPGHPNINTDKPVCLEMFQIDESWWTAADCELKRASVCSYPISA
uniref:C-type lectin domain-containing protein n=1 Tax=Scophthalmus maximus TaxID=52904 RepID=A0A8D2ZJA4_SCOMX